VRPPGAWYEPAARPQVLSSTEDLAAALEHQPGRPGLGDPGAGDAAGLELAERLGVLLRADDDVAAAVLVDGEALLDQPGAQRDVLGAAGLRAGELLAAQLLRVGDVARDDERRAAEVAPATIRSASPWLLTKPLIAGLGPEVGGVQAAGEQRLDGGRPGVEHLGLERGAAELAAKVPAPTP
jgi:hypothetical protein